MNTIPTQTLVDLKDVSKEYLVNGSPVKVLDHITLQIPSGEIVVILGRSGAGKTTLLNLIAGLEKPTTGTVSVADVDLTSADEKVRASFRCKNIGFVFQSYNLVSTLTCAENVELMMELAGSNDFDQNETRAKELISALGLSERANHLPSQLSGGEQQRVAIARALANDPDLILADEPTGNLDLSTGLEIVKLLSGLKEHGKTVIVTAHDERIVELADRVYHLENGRI